METDRNNDGFLDVPLSQTASFLHRWEYQGKKFETRFGFNVSYDERKGGQVSRIDSAYRMLNRNRHYDFFAKTGWIFDKRGHSFGVVYRLKKQEMNGNYGVRELFSDEVSGNVIAIYDGEIGSAAHKYRAGGSLFYQNITQRSGFVDKREYAVPGAFFEYTYTGIRTVAVLGARHDAPVGFKQQFSPRAHLKFILDERTDLRLTAGKAWRLPLILSDNYFLLANLECSC
jgi:outer membrane receptor protein involved in Fe transport